MILDRRQILAGAAASGLLGLTARGQQPASNDRALVAISLDLEMSRHYPTRDQMHWDYEKGNLDTPTKRYAVEAARRVKAHGGLIHFFAVGQLFEQEDVSWIERIAAEGHCIGNHTYDHVHLRARTLDDVQFKFKRAPWLVEGKAIPAILAENIDLTQRAMFQRIGHRADGFRTPGGFADGLDDRPDLRAMLKSAGFRWVSSKYPAHPTTAEGQEPTPEILAGIVEAQARAQPYRYEDGLIEVPMSPISDVVAMRTGRWKLSWFLKAIERALDWCIANGKVFDFLSHPSCLVVEDPRFEVIELICEKVRQAGPRAAIVSLDTLAERAVAG